LADIDQTIAALMNIDGTTAAAIVSSSTGATLGKAGSGINLDIAGAACTELVRAGMKTMKVAGNPSRIEDILIFAGDQHHMIHPLTLRPDLFFYIVLAKDRGNIVVARLNMVDIEAGLKI
jgi:hypothetical protein